MTDLWSVDELGACFVVRDEAGLKLAYVYFEEDPGQRSAAELLTKDETMNGKTGGPVPALGEGREPQSASRAA